MICLGTPDSLKAIRMSVSPKLYFKLNDFLGYFHSGYDDDLAMYELPMIAPTQLVVWND